MDSQLFETYQKLLTERLNGGTEASDEEIGQLIDSLIFDMSPRYYVPLSRRCELRTLLFNSVRRLDVIQELIDDDSVTEIMVNGMDGIFLERQGRLEKWDRNFDSREKLEDIVLKIASGCNRTVSESDPIVDARLKNGARVNVVVPPAAINGPIITIRRFPDHPITMQQLVQWGGLPQEAADFLKKMVEARYNIFISGGTGSGKTTFLNALSAFIPDDERVITIEDNAELQLRHVKNLVRLEARRANDEGENEISIRDLIRTSLRMRPDRIIVGEVRGAETVDLLQALNTGHDGGLSTGHGNSPRDMLSRLEMMVLCGMSEIPVSAIRRQIASGIDLMVHLGRLRDKSRRVLEILEIDGFDIPSGEIITHSLFEFQETPSGDRNRIIGTLVKTGELKNTSKLEKAGLSV